MFDMDVAIQGVRVAVDQYEQEPSRERCIQLAQSLGFRVEVSSVSDWLALYWAGPDGALYRRAGDDLRSMGEELLHQARAFLCLVETSQGVK